jgi:hypothetical protein
MTAGLPPALRSTHISGLRREAADRGTDTTRGNRQTILNMRSGIRLHRWILLRPPGRATGLRQGDVANVTMAAPDAHRAKEFYEAVLQVPFSPAHPGTGVITRTM